ncbi:putative secreted chitinase [Mycobacteroides abscessus subsp. massiliense]|uniref:peptidoglycan recognition protein family protein n=1 Tax=Mycobacteroides abscessus TaxID=36809 RepID=UPI0009A86405|nr:peptidoglycan recognition family protein [Mycobacteroides abscessus]SKM80734.1 metalloendopeptidase-like membrane protein [Mycobacteroides abscessus subsp. massiliense]SKM97092.1 putative secreted chitinase [Mycobacteroides abscessus subsp. massiliense]SKN76029.1 putative secreted chitinase [Mycobacteroides abscessus subsp. massiliense]SKN97186.1 putative secreted chitinase [Mycobacteroides abscessus subsp. massiliense]SKO20674.1 putative secreted chitinase [Mycobacteroides abscessus subsp.
MSFVWQADMPLRTREQIAREVHAVSLARGLDELATVLTLMCISVEAGTGQGDDRKWWCPWNAADPSSKNYPYDSQSNDGRSVGYFQQQNGRAGDTLPYGDRDNWWGSMRSRMTLAQAADVFQTRLADDYGRAANNPTLAGQFVQRVQGSAFPDRYAERWDEAWAVLQRALAQGPVTPTPPLPPITAGSPITRTRYTTNHEDGRSGITPRWIVVHTQEGGRTAWDLAGFLITTQGGPNPVSYNAVVDDTETVLCVDWSDAPWSAANANDYGFHICMAGTFSAWSRGKWLETDNSDGKNEDAELTRTAQLIAWLCRTYNIPATYIGGNGIPWGSDGICGHRDFGSWGGGHTDPGSDFPWDELIRRVNTFLTSTGADDDMAQVPQNEWQEVLNYVRGQTEPLPSLSPLRHLSEGNVNTRANLPRAIDANGHVSTVIALASEGHTPSIALLWEVSTAADSPSKYPDRQEDAKLAKTLLTAIPAAKQTVAAADINAWLDAEKGASK